MEPTFRRAEGGKTRSGLDGIRFTVHILGQAVIFVRSPRTPRCGVTRMYMVVDLNTQPSRVSSRHHGQEPYHTQVPAVRPLLNQLYRHDGSDKRVIPTVEILQERMKGFLTFESVKNFENAKNTELL